MSASSSSLYLWVVELRRLLWTIIFMLLWLFRVNFYIILYLQFIPRRCQKLRKYIVSERKHTWWIKNWEGHGTKRSWPNLRYISICLEAPKKTVWNLSRKIRSPVPDMKELVPEQEAQLTRERCLIPPCSFEIRNGWSFKLTPLYTFVTWYLNP